MTDKNKEKEFTDLLLQHQAIVYKVCLLYAQDKEDLADLYQETVYNLWKSYGTFENRSSFGTWVYRIALNTCITDLRRRKRHEYVPLRLTDTDLTDDDPQDEMLNDLYSLGRQATPHQRETENHVQPLTLHYHESGRNATSVEGTQRTGRTQRNPASGRSKENPEHTQGKPIGETDETGENRTADYRSLVSLTSMKRAENLEVQIRYALRYKAAYNRTYLILYPIIILFAIMLVVNFHTLFNRTLILLLLAAGIVADYFIFHYTHGRVKQMIEVNRELKQIEDENREKN